MRLFSLIALALVACAARSAPPESARVAPARSSTPSVRPAAAAPSPAPAREPVELPFPIERARLEKDVAWLAQARPPNSPHHRRVQRKLGTRLEQLGFLVERHAYGTGVNVVGRRRDAPERAEQVIVSAHYDHVAGCPGADDNASGVAAVLEIARVLAQARRAQSLVVAFWDEEELALTGSRAFAGRARRRSERIRLAISLDGVGYATSVRGSQRVPPSFDALLPKHAALLAERGYTGDFIALVANTAAGDGARRFARHAQMLGLPLMSLELSPLEWLAVPDVFRSDHASFWQQGYPALLLSDTAEFRNPGYHCARRRDTPRTLSYDFLTRVTQVTAMGALELAQM